MQDLTKQENKCRECEHPFHTGCWQCDAGIPQTPNGWDGHAVHGFTDEQLQCPVQGCSCNDPQ